MDASSSGSYDSQWEVILTCNISFFLKCKFSATAQTQMLFQKHFVLMVRILTKIHLVYLPSVHPFLNFDSKILPPFLPWISRKHPSINWLWIVLSDFKRQRWWVRLVIANGKRNSASIRLRFHFRECGAVLLCPCSQNVTFVHVHSSLGKRGGGPYVTTQCCLEDSIFLPFLFQTHPSVFWPRWLNNWCLLSRGRVYFLPTLLWSSVR